MRGRTRGEWTSSQTRVRRIQAVDSRMRPATSCTAATSAKPRCPLMAMTSSRGTSRVIKPRLKNWPGEESQSQAQMVLEVLPGVPRMRADVHILAPQAQPSRPAEKAKRWTAQEIGIRGTTPVVTLGRVEAAQETGRATPLPRTELAKEVTMATVQVVAATVAPETAHRPRNCPIEALRMATKMTEKAKAIPRARESQFRRQRPLRRTQLKVTRLKAALKWKTLEKYQLPPLVQWTALEKTTRMPLLSVVTVRLLKLKGPRQTLKPKLSQRQSLVAPPKTRKRGKAQRTPRRAILATAQDRDEDDRREAAAGVIPEAEPGLDRGQG